MKTSFRLLFLLLGLCLFTVTSCTDDEDPQSTALDTLNYDGPNDRAPFNGVGLNTFAAFFPESEIAAFTGRRLTRIDFWLEAIPDVTSVVVFAASTDDRTPGTEIYRLNLTQRINNTGWYEHVIPADRVIELTGDGIWLAVETTLSADGTQAIGCDNGANYNSNGDRLLPPTGGTWTSFNEITGSEAINWNIRGVLAAE